MLLRAGFSLLMNSDFPRELVLGLGSVVDRPGPYLAHLCAMRPAMNNFRPELIDKKPCTIALVPFLVKVPTPLIRDSILIKPFRCATSGFSNPDRSLTEPSE